MPAVLSQGSELKIAHRNRIPSETLQVVKRLFNNTHNTQNETNVHVNISYESVMGSMKWKSVQSNLFVQNR